MVFVSIIIAASVTIINFLDVKRISSEKPPPLGILPLLLIVTICLPIVVVLLCLFKLYRECIGMILKIKHGERFMEVLNGPDAVHMATETIQNVINSVLIYQCPNTMSPKEFYETLKVTLREAYVLPRLNVIVKQEFGYSYILKERSNFNNGFRRMGPIKTENYKLDKKELTSLINKYANSHLPKDDTILWEILVGSQPVEWKNDNYNYYFALCRYHHLITDGKTLMKLIVASHADKEDTARTSSENVSTCFSDIMKICKRYSETFLAFMLIPSWFVSSFVLKRRAKHILLGNKLRKRCHYAIKIEDQPDYVEKLKRIGTKIPGTSSYSVLLTAFSASLNEFFVKINRLIEHTVWAYLPQKMLAYLLGLVNYTAIVCFLPGIPKVTCFDGAINISDFLLWSTHGLDIGTSILMYTYDGRLHTSMSIDEALVQKSGDVQEIVDNIWKYLDVLEEKIP